MKQRTIRVSLSGDKFYDHLAIVKSCDGRAYDKGSKQWVIPLTDDNVQRLSLIPSLTEQLEVEMQRMKLEESQLTKDALKLKEEYPFLFDYQAIGSYYALNKKFFLIADEMGLGKTVQSMPLIDKYMKEDRLVIILAPKTLLPQWRDEIKRFIGYKSVIVDGTSRKIQRLTTYNSNMIILSTYESFAIDVKSIAIDWSNVVVIADEALKFKNTATQIWRALNFIRPRVHSFIAMTGTPIENSLHNFFNIITIINPEFMTEREFRNNYCIWESNDYGSRIVGYKSLDAFLKRVSGIMIRRRKSDVTELPEKVVQNRVIDLSPSQKRLISGIRSYAEANWGTENAVQAMMLLREVVDCPQLFYSSSSPLIKSLKMGKYVPTDVGGDLGGKLPEVLGVIDELGENKVIIFTQFKTMARIIRDYMLEHNYRKPLLLTGDNSQEERMRGIEEFKEGKYQVMIATEIFSYGMNLQFADILINYDIPWNPARLNQRIDRIHRIGATRGKIIINLIAEDIEEKVYDVVRSKQDLFDKVVNGEAIDDDSVRKEILQKLIGED